VRVREIDDDEGQRLLQIIRRGIGSVVTWRRAQTVLLSARGKPVEKIATVTFTRPDRVRDVLHNFNAAGFDSLYPKYKGGRPSTFTLPERREIKKIAKSKPAEHGLPFSTSSLVKLADFLVAPGGHQPRGPAAPAPRGGRLLSTREDLEILERPRLRGQEGPGRAPLRDRRRRGHPRAGRARRHLLHETNTPRMSAYARS
jgi:transposase